MSTKTYFCRAVAASALALGVVFIVAPAKATTVNDFISFSITGTYATDSDPTHGYQGLATATGSFNITFDPTQLYLPQSITGIITNLTYSITDPFFNPLPISLNAIQYFGYDGAGTLKLSSDSGLSTSLDLSMNITIGINGWAYGTASSVWYSQDEYGHTLTGSGTATITPREEVPGLETPLPAALPLFGTGLGVLGLLGWRRKRKPQVAA